MEGPIASDHQKPDGLRTQAADISARLKHRRLGAHTVQMKVRYGDFTTLTRRITVEDPLTEAGDSSVAFRYHISIREAHRWSRRRFASELTHG